MGGGGGEGHFILSGDSGSIITTRRLFHRFESPRTERRRRRRRKRPPVMRCELVFLVAQPVAPCHSLVRFPQRKQPRLVPASRGTRLDSALPPFETSERTPLCVLSVNGHAKQSNYVDLCSDTSLLLVPLFFPRFSFSFFSFFLSKRFWGFSRATLLQK